MDQAEALSGLLPELRKIAPDILLYTGYTIEQLHGMKDENIEAALSQLSVLVDGEYIKKRNNNCPMRGSDNQKVLFFDKAVREKYEEYMRSGNAIQNFSIGISVVSVGIHSADYPERLEKLIAEKNLIIE